MERQPVAAGLHPLQKGRVKHMHEHGNAAGPELASEPSGPRSRAMSSGRSLYSMIRNRSSICTTIADPLQRSCLATTCIDNSEWLSR